MAKKLVDLVDGQVPGSSKNNRYENRYTDAVTGKGVGISKTDYSSPRSNNNQSGNLYAEAVAKNAESGAPWVSSAEKAAAAAAAGGLYGSLAGAQQPTTKPKQPTTKPTQPGTSGDGKVTYIDPNGDAQKGTTETPRTYLDDLKDQ